VLKLSFALWFGAILATGQPTIVKTTTLIDGKGRVLKDQEIVIENGRITRICGSQTEADDRL
jgi:cytosine/adenosine deaminase-related metal-dependent hydrolase